MEQVRSNDRGTYDYLDHSNLGSHEPQGMSFGGPVVILQDGGSFSATSEFLSVVRHADRAVFVGEESGGGYYGNTSGLGTSVTLPNDRSADPDPDRGLLDGRARPRTS